MKVALTSLTTRGRVFLTAGLTTIAMALAFGQMDVLRVGLLISVLPVLAAASVARTRFRLTSQRRLDPSRISTGESATVSLQLHNVAALPTGLLLVEDHVPVTLGARPRFVVDRLAPHATRQVSYTVRAEARGRYPVGPVALRVTDPFGLCSVERRFEQTDTLVVAPQVVALPPVSLVGDFVGQGESRARSVAAAGDDDVAVRAYRRGDELRRVHWPSTARQGMLMVRREEQPWESKATVVLDTRPGAFRGHGRDSAFERAVSTAASIGLHLGRRGFEVHLTSPNSPDIVSPAHEPGSFGSDAEGFLLDALAVVQPSSHDLIDPMLTALRHAGDILAVVVLGHATPTDVEALARTRHATGATVVVLCDVASWLPNNDPHIPPLRRERDHAISVLRQSGWRVVTLARTDSIAEVWQRVGVRHRTSWSSALDLGEAS